MVRLAAARGLDVIALTDHDSAAGWPEALAAGETSGVTVLPGMEISTSIAGASVHVLGYRLDPEHLPLAQELSRILDGRDGRLAVMVEQLRAAGIDITVAEVLQRVGRSPAIGRPHVADVLVAKGIVSDRSEAFARWLSAGRPGHVVRYAPDTLAMVQLIRSAGGAAVLAHPWGRGSRDVLDESTLESLASGGLAGLEVDHQDHDASDRQRLGSIARNLGLVVTGSSDFHGDGKINHDLGCNLTAPDQLDRLLALAAHP